MHFLDQLMPPDGAATGLPDVPDLGAVKARLQAVFARYGEVRRLDLVRADQGSLRQVMCFVRMACPEAEQRLVEALGMGRFGGDLVLVVMLDAPPAVPVGWAPAQPAGGAQAGLH